MSFLNEKVMSKGLYGGEGDETLNLSRNQKSSNTRACMAIIQSCLYRQGLQAPICHSPHVLFPITEADSLEPLYFLLTGFTYLHCYLDPGGI